jgi:hypothetical protein
MPDTSLIDAEDETERFLAQRAERIKAHMCRVAQDIIEIGRDLSEAREMLGQVQGLVSACQADAAKERTLRHRMEETLVKQHPSFFKAQDRQRICLYIEALADLLTISAKELIEEEVKFAADVDQTPKERLLPMMVAARTVAPWLDTFLRAAAAEGLSLDQPPREAEQQKAMPPWAATRRRHRPRRAAVKDHAP